jgi:hypothetical protein
MHRDRQRPPDRRQGGHHNHRGLPVSSCHSRRTGQRGVGAFVKRRRVAHHEGGQAGASEPARGCVAAADPDHPDVRPAAVAVGSPRGHQLVPSGLPGERITAPPVTRSASVWVAARTDWLVDRRAGDSDRGRCRQLLAGGDGAVDGRGIAVWVPSPPALGLVLVRPQQGTRVLRSEAATAGPRRYEWSGPISPTGCTVPALSGCRVAA